MKSQIISQSVVVSTVILVLHVSLVSSVLGDIIATRANLNALLGSNAITEDFESFVFPANSAERVGTELDADSVIEGQGPGLVRGGVRFEQVDPAAEGLQWDRQFQYGLQSAALVTDGALVVDFTTPVSHVGLDMFWFDVMFPLAHPATVHVFGADDVSIIHSVEMFEPFAPDFVFVGFADNAGIGRIVLFRNEVDGELGASPIIDNLTFGVVPEPGIFAHALLGLMIAARARFRSKMPWN